MFPLSRLSLGKTARVLSLSASEPLLGRLLDLGFVPGGEITPLYAAPTGDPRAYLVCDTVIALRQKDAAAVAVEAQ
ncbi:MAG: ferrous iron transport protein A [Clostridia bacterium]|nr:ferrous iron transport protein A [Clostridia bacterium]